MHRYSLKKNVLGNHSINYGSIFVIFINYFVCLICWKRKIRFIAKVIGSYKICDFMHFISRECNIFSFFGPGGIRDISTTRIRIIKRENIVPNTVGSIFGPIRAGSRSGAKSSGSTTQNIFRKIKKKKKKKKKL